MGRLVWAGLGALVVLIASFGIAQYRFAQIQARFDEQLAGNPFAERARDSFASPQIEWGWIVLALGGGLIVFAALNQRKAEEAVATEPADHQDKNYEMAAGLSVAIGLAMIGIAHFNTDGPSTRNSMADATEAIAERGAREVAAEAEANAIEREKQDYISQNIEVYELEARYMDSMLDGRVPGVTFKVRNNGERTLDRVEVTIEFLDAEGNSIAEEIYHPVIAGGYSSDPPLRPGYIWQNERGRFYSAKAVPSEWQSGRARAIVTDIEFAEEE